MDDTNILYGPKPLYPIEDETAGEHMFKALKKYAQIPDCIALTDVHTKENVLYKELLESTCQLAHAFKNYGLGIDSTIAVCSENNLQFFVPVIASLYIGTTVASVNGSYAERELLHNLDITKPTVIFCSKEAFKNISKVRPKISYVKDVVIIDHNDDWEGCQCLKSFISKYSDPNFKSESFKPSSFDCDKQIALVMYSSGTTGFSKGVMVTHKNIVVRFSICKDPTYGNQINPTTAILTVIPFQHGFGMFTTLGYLTCGFRVVLMRYFDEEIFLRSLQDYKISSTVLVPSLMSLFAKSALVGNYDLSHLEEIASGGAPLSKEISEIIKKRFKLNFVRQGYGLTETTSAILITPEIGIKPGSTGKIVPLHAVKVIDPKTKEVLGPHQVGELYFKGDMIMKGYFDNPKETDGIIDSDGWLRSGDLAYYDEEGHFFIVDRLKSLIKYKGHQIAPAEIEAVLLQHPWIIDAGVTGIQDSNANEVPAAGVVLKKGKYLSEETVKNFVASQLSPPKWLRGGVTFLDVIPKGPTGKIDTKVLKEILSKPKSKL